MRLSRLDIHIILNVLIGILIGGVLVAGLSHREMGSMDRKIEYQLERLRALEAEVGKLRRCP